MTDWNAFPHDASDFQYEDGDLQDQWPVLHLGDCESWPEDEILQSAWSRYHAGEFGQAVKLADQCGLVGHAVANKATGVYASYLEPDDRRQGRLFLSAVERAESAIQQFPDDPNSHYFHAFNLGRYSQSISIVKALKQGIGGRIQKSLQRALALQPEHAEAHTAMGLYHAEIIDKIGKMIGGMTYGASTDEALSHLQTAVELTPDAPIAYIEYANGLYLLFGDRRLDEVTDLYVRASEMTPHDAMEKLDIEAALAELE
jgi:tetratricopeptide (TPR) repeat protein